MVITNLHLIAAYMEARTRTLDHASGVVTLFGTRDHLFTEAKLLERELAVFRMMRHRIPAKQLPHYSAETRGMILQLIAMRKWCIKKTAKRMPFSKVHNLMGHAAKGTKTTENRSN